MDVSREVEKLERVVSKTGGRFRLSVLMQKRLRQLQRREIGAPAPDIKKLMLDVVNEIDEGKTELVTEDVYRESLRMALAKSQELKKEK